MGLGQTEVIYYGSETCLSVKLWRNNLINLLLLSGFPKQKMIKIRPKSKASCDLFNLYKIIPSVFLISGNTGTIFLSHKYKT